MGNLREPIAAKECFSIKKSNLDVLEEISNALGMTKEEILDKIIEKPESGKILLEAARQIKRLK